MVYEGLVGLQCQLEHLPAVKCVFCGQGLPPQDLPGRTRWEPPGAPGGAAPLPTLQRWESRVGRTGNTPGVTPSPGRTSLFSMADMRSSGFQGSCDVLGHAGLTSGSSPCHRPSWEDLGAEGAAPGLRLLLPHHLRPAEEPQWLYNPPPPPFAPAGLEGSLAIDRKCWESICFKFNH